MRVGSIGSANGNISGIPHGAPFTNLVQGLAHQYQWESFPALQPPLSYAGAGYAFGGGHDPWALFSQGDSHDYHGNLGTFPLPAEFPVFNDNHLEGPISNQQLGFDIDQPLFFPDIPVDNFDLQPPILAAQPPVFVAPAPAPFASATAHRRTPAQPGAINRLHCPLGCRATFGRPGDYRRHMRKHEPPRYKCMVMECDKTFTRADKLRDHMRQGRRMQVMLA